VRHRCRRLGRSHPAIAGGLEQLAPIGFVEHMLAVVVEQLAVGWPLVRKLAVAAAQLVRLEHKSVAEQLAVGLVGIELELVGLGPERIAELEPVELGLERIAGLGLVELGPERIVELALVELGPERIAGLGLVELEPERIAGLEPVELGPERIADIEEPGLVGLALGLAERIAVGIGPGLVGLALELVERIAAGIEPGLVALAVELVVVGEQLEQQQGQQQRRPLGLEPGRCQFVALAESTG